jgi:hypothetical protein
MDVNLEEAAILLHLSSETIRRRVKRGLLIGRIGPDGRVLVTLPDELAVPTDGVPTSVGKMTAHGTPPPTDDRRMTDGVPTTDSTATAKAEASAEAAEAEATHLRGLLASVEAHRDSLAAQVEVQRQQIAALQQQAELQAQVDAQAQAELRQLLLQAQLQVQALIPKLPVPGETEEKRRRWWWPFG